MEKREEMSLECFQFDDDEIHNLMSVEPPPETGNSFTALLELPPNQAVKLLHSPGEATPNVFASVFWATKMENSPETTSSLLPNSSHNNCNSVKQEAAESPVLSDPVISKSTTKRKEREKKVKSWAKKIKKGAKETDADKLPYVHVRARRGEATDSHSIAERARREKINARMKLLQELVPGCNKISGTAMVLDKIINHVQCLQRQVEFLSMSLAAVHPRIDVNLDSLFSSESGSTMDCYFTSMIANGNTQQIWHPDGLTNFITSENSLLRYDYSANSAPMLTSQLKMEL